MRPLRLGEMKSLLPLAVLGTSTLWLFSQPPPRIHVGAQADGSYLLPTGQRLRPIGRTVEVSDRPLGIALSPAGRLAAVVTGSNFAPRALHLIDLQRMAVRQTLPIRDSFTGVAFDKTGDRLFVGGGSSNAVLFFRRNGEGSYVSDGEVPIPGAAPSGLALDPAGEYLYVACNLKHSVARIHLSTQKVEEWPTGSFPYTVAIARNRLFVSNWAGRRPRPGDTTDGVHPVVVDPRTGIPSSGTLSVFNLETGALVAEIEVGLHPSAMAVSADASTLYVANANSDTVTVVNVAQARAERVIPVSLYRNAPLGSAPNALALLPGGSTLLVANGANNAVAVLDVRRRDNPVRGFLPAGWYPTAVTATPDGRQILVASGYGLGSVAPLKAGDRGRSYRDRMGIVSLIPMEEIRNLRTHTENVRRDNRAPGTVPSLRGRPPQPIEHVIYVIKENRTYDQILGDLPQGNGDSSLALFGRDVTPNHHALAEEYVLLDNFYTPADQSALGHRWCTQGYASDWVFKYGNGRNDQNPMLFAPTEFLWDNARRNGVSVRSFGERGLNTIIPESATWTDIYADWKTGAGKIAITPRAVILGLRDVYSRRVPAYELRVPDQVRVDRFLEEFRAFERERAVPKLMVLLLSQDHTAGTNPGFPTPRAMLADNDLALGRLIEAVSNSSIWRKTAVFVVEDDAQSGVDHVDGHRTVALVVSPWTRSRGVDSAFYTTINLYRTMELLLGLPPSNQFDLAADPMFSIFVREPGFTPYRARPNQVPLEEMNPPLRALRGEPLRYAEASMAMDLDEPDVAPEDFLNRAIWHSVRGFETPYPSPRQRQYRRAMPLQ